MFQQDLAKSQYFTERDAVDLNYMKWYLVYTYVYLKSKKKPPIAMMYALINVGWRLRTRTNVSKTEGVHSFCCGFLSKKIKIWQKIIFNAENNWLWTNRTILSHMAVHIRHGRLAGYLTAIHHPEITVERGSREIVSLPNSWYWNRDLEQQPIDRSKCPC